METENKIEINVDALCVLKFIPNSELVMVDYEPIQRSIDSDFEQLKSQFDLDNNDAKSILVYIKQHEKLKVLLEKYNYCRTLWDSFQELSSLEAKYKSNFKDPLTRAELIKREKERLLNDLEVRLQAFYINSAYKICEEKRLQRSMLAYSHRKMGWELPKYELNPDFSIAVKTNFGYGSSSYFYTRIKYKGLDIIPFSDWTIYKYARRFEIISYSQKYQLENESWKEALAYCKEACNISLTDETAFVKKYIIDECERMVTDLEGFLVGNEFTFWNLKKISTDVHMEGRNLIEFRGEKLSGALSFIEKIVQFSKIVEINEFVTRIENCNKKVQPMLVREIPLIDKELVERNEQLADLKPVYEQLEKQNENYLNLKNALKEKVIASKDIAFLHFTFQDLEKKFKEEYPEYEKHKNFYIQNKKEYEALTAQILSLNTTKGNIEKYSVAIETYFKGII